MSNNLVAYSRAGDVFHYRWAARRCLRLIYPNSYIDNIFIEGSEETEKEGEYVIDVAEYSTIDNIKKIDYYQLKHTTVHQDDPFRLSDLKDTFIGFAKRYIQHKSEKDFEISKISFIILTNRIIGEVFKKNLKAILEEQKVDSVFLKTIKKYTNLTGDDLVSFCTTIQIQDGQGNYNVQRDELRIELTQLIAGSIDNAQIDSLVALVQEKVLPDSEGIINREEVLKRFGITSSKQLYPAPAVWEYLDKVKVIKRKQHDDLKYHIGISIHPIIVHAAGGVGKSVFCCQLLSSLPEGSLGIAYDCFGAGSYRNRSESRHKHRDALVQIINELASKGLCDPLLIQNTTLDEDIMRKFLSSLETSLNSLRKTVNSAQLYILIDAADNAEMAAKEYTQECFAHELLREKMPEGCKLILLCRTERIYLLQPQSFITQLELEPFSKEETIENLRTWFPKASEKDGVEFHRLTSGNPRVQANALDAKYNSIKSLLNSLGPGGTSVEDQIELQLQSAILKIKDQLPPDYHNHINSICLGLASLPPHIPIDVLSQISTVSVDHIKSFVSDIGRSLWLSDLSIQFRDEPTETWFRNTFLAKKEHYVQYISILEPLAKDLTYVAEVLPQLYLQSEQYEKLINIALSDDFLPINNPIDARNIRVYRLQFAFKASLKLNNYKDAVKVAMRAGEEVAGSQRQLDLFKSNIDLLVKLQSKEKIQEIAFKRLLSNTWDGSENVYSASLLSGVADYHGEARGYLRAAMNWLVIYYNKFRKTGINRRDEISDDDILELAYAHFNILGMRESVQFLKRFNSKIWIYGIVKELTERLIDIGNYTAIDEFLQNCKDDIYFTVAVTSELIRIGRFPETLVLETGLDLLCSTTKRISKEKISYQDSIIPGIVSFAEACLHRKLDSQKISKIIKYYLPEKASRMVYESHSFGERTIFLKALSIRIILSKKNEVNFEKISPEEFNTNKKNYELNGEIKKLKEVVYGMFPWYLLRARILYDDDKLDLVSEVLKTYELSQKARNGRYEYYDTFPREICQVCSSIILFYQKGLPNVIEEFFMKFLDNDKAFILQDRIDTLRGAVRLKHLESITHQLEISSYHLIKNYQEDGPEEIGNRYISLARAVLANSPDDASVYFDEAIAIASKFGNEIVQRWESIVSLARKACDKQTVSDELAYRFIRCAELVGENVSREKYWNRTEAIRICTRLSPGIGISSLSRWRDRDIGRFEYELEAVLNELISSKLILPTVGWSLTRFLSSHHSYEFLSLCLENEISQNRKQNIFDDAVYLLQVEGTNYKYWKNLEELANKHNIENKDLNYIINFYSKNEGKSKIISNNDILKSGRKVNDDDELQNLENIFIGLNISTLEGLITLVERFKLSIEKDQFHWKIKNLLKEIINRLERNTVLNFIDAVLQVDDVGYYEVEFIFTNFPQELTSKVSYRVKLPSIFCKIGERFAYDLTDKYLFNSFTNTLNLNKDVTENLVIGIIAGLKNGNEFVDADIFFGFVNLVSTNVKDQDVVDLIDYSICRFELHLEDGFGEGNWNDSLSTSKNVNKNIAGFIWSALGSPRSEIRWNAVHCVKKIADFNCFDIIDELVLWLKSDKVNAFGHHNFPFYNLHARQYLLMAFARISNNQSEALNKHSQLFLDYALSSNHLLIQKFSADIILNVENRFSGTYSDAVLTSVKNVGKSKMPILEEDYHYSTDSYWHKQDQIDLKHNYHFGLDIGKYWYEPLGDVFGVSENQIEDLAANVILKEWKLEYKKGYYNDPRISLWNNSSGERETRYHKMEYPKTDNLDFYLSYHAMLVVAAKLIEKMPVIKVRDWIDNSWLNWLSRHMLTREDGKWLSECRDAIPLSRPTWVFEEKKDSWESDIREEDFLNCLKFEENGEQWINVKGAWHESENDQIETFSISTALVSPKTSDSLLRALDTCSDPYDYKLPYFNEEDTEVNSGMFVLKGWINDRYNEIRLDRFDPYADGVIYPPYSLGSTIIENLGLSVDEEGKVWKFSDSNVMICETWSSLRERTDEDPDQSGMRLKVKLSFLKYLCLTLGYDLIFDISIKRDVKYRYNRDKRIYTDPKHKIFILSKDGKLRTRNKNYRLG
ncbi:hypothetical protein GKZ90_0001135 [Flavobacterium sp. MC2016-06]|jgi:hypothetical protein|uniref:ATP-binding protein n=1 Tax=Flavobacterium sp. MC2016-06 TaxID=2676308 RepID=UPI0012BA88D9|nr:ATP-binding protein [Flavobacterium sp. MC2016-06]MBU3859085.1 hypothetical protein [Flavobacterium sp. MC2016-06]